MIFIDKPLSSVALFTLAALIDCEEPVYYRPVAEHDQLIKKINPTAIEYTGRLDLMDAVMTEESIESVFTLRIVEETVYASEPVQETSSSAVSSGCSLVIPCLYQQLTGPKTENVIEAVDAEDVALAAATILTSSSSSSSTNRKHHRGQAYHLPGHQISPEFLAAIKHRLPKNPFDSPATVTTATTGIQNDDWHKLIPGHEVCSIEEFLNKCERSLFHQRFVAF
jgi:hypothetical protein